MATKTSMVYTTVDSSENVKQKTVTNISPSATREQVKTFAQKLAALTEDTYAGAAIVERVEVEENLNDLPFAPFKLYTGKIDGDKVTKGDFVKTRDDCRLSNGVYELYIDIAELGDYVFKTANDIYVMRFVVEAEAFCVYSADNTDTERICLGDNYALDTTKEAKIIELPMVFNAGEIFGLDYLAADAENFPKTDDSTYGDTMFLVSGGRAYKPWKFKICYYDSSKEG